VATITLAHEEGWEQQVSFAPIEVGEEQKVEIQLYKGDTSNTFHILDLWVDVVGSQ